MVENRSNRASSLILMSIGNRILSDLRLENGRIIFMKILQLEDLGVLVNMYQSL